VGFSSGLLLAGFPTRTLCTSLLSPIHATCPALFSLLDSILEWYLMRSTERKVPGYVVHSAISHLSQAQTSYSASYSRKLPAYVPPSKWTCATSFKVRETCISPTECSSLRKQWFPLTVLGCWVS
jgi:hypothetical protein